MSGGRGTGGGTIRWERRRRAAPRGPWRRSAATSPCARCASGARGVRPARWA